MEKHGGRFPGTYEDIRALPGVGDYTAGAIASICFNEPRAAGTKRPARLRLTAQNYPTPADKKRLAGQISALYPEGQCGDFTQSLMELGALVCTPQSPKCGACPVLSLCRAHAEGCVNAFPARKAAKEKRAEALTVLILTRGEDIAMRRRAPEGLLGGLWELPNALGHLDEAGAIALAEHSARPSELVRSGCRPRFLARPLGHALYHMPAAREDFALSGSADNASLSCGTGCWVSRGRAAGKHSSPRRFQSSSGQAGIVIKRQVYFRSAPARH